MARRERPGAGGPKARPGSSRVQRSGFRAAATPGHPDTWKLEDAKARFSEVVRRARDEGPQYVTVRGEPAVAIIDVAELERLQPHEEARLPFVAFMESLYVEGLDLECDRDRGRDIDL